MSHAAVSGSRCDSCHNGCLHRRRHEGRRRHGVLRRPRRDEWPRLHHLPCQRAAGLHQLGGRHLRAPGGATPTARACHNGTTATGMTTPPHIPYRRVQCSNCHTNTATSFTTYTMNHSAVSGEPLRLLPQRLLHLTRHKGCARHGLFPKSRCDERTGLRQLPRQRRGDLRQLGRRYLYSPAERHQLLELPQRNHRDRYDHAAAYTGHRRPVQQLPHQYGGELPTPTRWAMRR